MKENVHTKWQPMPAIEGLVIIDKIEDSNDGLSIFFHTTRTCKKFKIVFDPYIEFKGSEFKGSEILKGLMVIAATERTINSTKDIKKG